jgi:GT2 family glycosyltransferase
MKTALLKFAYSLLGKSPKKTRLVKKYKEDLAAFLDGGEIIRLPPINRPIISVLIPVFNSAYHTLRCLKSLAADQSCALEVIIFNNGSTDETDQLLKRYENIVVINSPINLGFVGATNAAAAQARGQFILMMNNDITIAKGKLGAAVRLFDTEPNIGAVGGLIKLATGRIQEAGALIYRDGSTNGFLRNRKHELPEGMFIRDVDYCSGAFLLLNRDYYLAIGGLDEIFAPGYYEETDLCMRLRSLGKRVVYTPEIALSHFEFGSFASGAAFERMERNRKIFVERWKTALMTENYAAPLTSSFVASRRIVSRPRLLLALPYASVKDVPDLLRLAIQKLSKTDWHIRIMLRGVSDVMWDEFWHIFSAKIEFIPDQPIIKITKNRLNFFDAVIENGIIVQDRTVSEEHETALSIFWESQKTR